MANEIQEHMHQFYERVLKLKEGNLTKELIDQMRIFHANAIIAYDNYKISIIHKTSAPVTNDELITLSKCESILYVIHSKIRKAEKKFYKKNYETKSNVPLSSSSSTPGSSSSGNTRPVINQKPDNSNNSKIKARLEPNPTGTDMMSISGLSTSAAPAKTLLTESRKNPITPPSYILPVSDFSPTNSATKKQAGGIDKPVPISPSSTSTSSMTDYINNISTTEAEKVLNGPIGSKIPSKTASVSYGTKSSLDVNKPTVINYWADWCGYSNNFLPEWKKFELAAKQKFPQVQVLDLNVEHNKELIDLASSIGVNGYPTTVVFCKGKYTPMVCGNKVGSEVMEFVQKCIQ